VLSSLVPPRTAECSSVITASGSRARLLDAIVHRPDLPVFPGGATRIGLELWNHVAATLVLELGLFIGWLITPWGFWIDRTWRSDLA
jgi:hypothetical protein